MTLPLLIAAALLAYANGANDNFKPVATLYGSGTLGYRASLGVATAAQLLGSLASVLLAGGLLAAFGGKGLVPDATVATPVFLVAVGFGAAGTVLLATRFGLPISTTHGLIGGLIGAALALAPSQISWAALGGRYVLPLVISPVLAVGAAAVLYPLARRARRGLGVTETTCLCVTQRHGVASISPDGSVAARTATLGITVDHLEGCGRSYAGTLVGVSAGRLVDTAHVASGFGLGFARGLNDTPKVLALLVAASWSGLSPRPALALIAVVMMAGGLLQSRRIAETMGHRITGMNRGQGLTANVIGTVLVIGASVLGFPVSTTHVSTGAIFGIGAWTGSTQPRVVLEIILAWVGTLPLAMLLAYAVASFGSSV